MQIKGKSKRWTVVLACWSSSMLCAAGPTLDSRIANLKDQKAAISQFLDGLAGQQAMWGTFDKNKLATFAAHRPPKISRVDLTKAAQSPYQTNLVVGSMGFLATIGAATIGSAVQNAQAALLTRYAALLDGNSNASLRQASVLLSAESQAIAVGDAGAAATLAQSITDIAPAAVPPGYQPNASDLSLSAKLETIDSYDWASAFLALGQAVMAGALGAMEGGVYGAVVGAAVSLAASAMQGEFTAQNSHVSQTGPDNSDTNSGLTGGPAQTVGSSAFDQAGLDSASPNPTAKIGAPLVLPQGASQMVLQPGKGSAAGGALVGAQQIP